MVRKFRGGENSSSKLVDTYSRGFIWDARNDALQGGPVRSHCGEVIKHAIDAIEAIDAIDAIIK